MLGRSNCGASWGGERLHRVLFGIFIGIFPIIYHCQGTSRGSGELWLADNAKGGMKTHYSPPTPGVVFPKGMGGEEEGRVFDFRDIQDCKTYKEETIDSCFVLQI